MLQIKPEHPDWRAAVRNRDVRVGVFRNGGLHVSLELTDIHAP
jgi:hypothetical protein